MSVEKETGVRKSQKESAPLIKEDGNTTEMVDKEKNGGSTFEENVKAAYGTKPRDPKTIGSNIKLKGGGGKEPTETEKLTLESSYHYPYPYYPQTCPNLCSTLSVLTT